MTPPNPSSGHTPRSRVTSPLRKRATLGCLVALATLIVGDLALSLLVLGDGLFLGQPLPPYGAVTDPAQSPWIRGLERGEGTSIGRFDPELGWDWIPDSHSPDGLFHINSQGARGTREYPPSPAADRLRLVTVGDSFTFGDEIADDRTFQAQLEQRNPALEVLNLGVSGYGTDQALLRYGRLGADSGARVALIGIMLENIGRNVNRYRPLWTPRTGFAATKPRFKLKDGHLQLIPQPFESAPALHRAIAEGTLLERIAEDEYWLDVPHLPTGRLSSLVRLAGLFAAHRARSPERLWRDPEGEPFRVTVELLAEFQRAALGAGAEAAAVLIFPAQSDLTQLRLQGSPYWRLLLDELERRGIPYIDLSVALSEAQDRIDAGEWEAGLYFGAHLSGAGNFIVAQELEAWLRSKGFQAAR